MSSSAYSMNVEGNQTERDERYYEGLAQLFRQSMGGELDKLRCFSKFVPRAELSRFLVRNELFQRILNVHGYIVECGVFLGGGLLSWGQLSSIYEPLNHVRRIVGFDTFEGFPNLSSKDQGADPNHARPGGVLPPSELESASGWVILLYGGIL